jgi:hypothetical protein
MEIVNEYGPSRAAAWPKSTLTSSRQVATVRLLMVDQMAKKTMTLNLTEKEMRVLEQLADRKALNKTAVIRQALRLYQAVEERISRGEKLYFEDDKKEKAEFVLL